MYSHESSEFDEDNMSETSLTGDGGDEELSDTESSTSETITYSSSLETDHSLSPSLQIPISTTPELAIDKAIILGPIQDTPTSEQIAIEKQKKRNWKLKRTKSVKAWNGFTKSFIFLHL